MKLREYDQAKAKKWSEKYSLPDHIAILLASRIKDESSLINFLNPSLNQLHSPILLPDIDTLVNLLVDVIKQRESILIYGHDDIDGFSAVSIMYEVLTDLGARVYYHIPNRIREGYFLNPDLLKDYREKGVTTILTVDFGSSNIKNFEIAKSAGLNLIITDHHEIIDSRLPGPTINPKRVDSQYPFRELAGVGVAYKVAQALAHRLLKISMEDFYNIKFEIIALVMIGSIADRAPLIDENRTFCRFGLEALKKTQRTVLKRLFNDSSLERINYQTILNELLPFIASARENQGVEVFLIRDELRAAEMVQKLRLQNEMWLTQLRNVYDEVFAAARVDSQIVISQMINGPINYLGPCATRLRDTFKRTALVIGYPSPEDGLKHSESSICFGELRGTDGSDLIALLKNAQDILIDFGGHRKAAGFTMHSFFFDDFVERARSFAEENFVLPEKPMGTGDEEMIVDLIWDIDKLDRSFEILLPFGEGNPAPILYDQSGILYTLDEDLNPIDPVRYTKILKKSNHKTIQAMGSSQG